MKLDPTLREGVSGHYYYHMSCDGVALCGNPATMQTYVPIAAWGAISPHLRERYCSKCAEIAGAAEAAEATSRSLGLKPIVCPNTWEELKAAVEAEEMNRE